MSSLATSPPPLGDSPPLHNWARMQAYQEAQLRQQSMEGGGYIGHDSDAYSMAEMAHMRRSEMSMARSGIDKSWMGGGMYASEGARGGSYGHSHLHDIPSSYRAGCSASAYFGHMAAERDYSREVDEFGEYPGGMKMNSVSSAVREVATRMNEARLGHAHNGSRGGHMRASHQHLEQLDMPDFVSRGGDMMSMREHMSAQMMRGGLHDGKMQHSYGAGMMMNLGGRMLKSQQGDSFAFQDSLMGVGGHGGVPYVAAQPPCLPFAAMHSSSYGAGGVGGGGMGRGGSGFDSTSMMHRSSASTAVPGAQATKHNKYCHFCQHVKVRASGMLACCNKDCTRRFCEHCLSKSIGDDVNPQTSDAWVNCQWHCPVCRKLCCCAIGECDKNHRHCKAYRYRVRRAEQQAVKRAGVSGPNADCDSDDDEQGHAGKMCLTAQDAVEIAELMDEGVWQAKAVVAKQLADAAATQAAVAGAVSAMPAPAWPVGTDDPKAIRIKIEPAPQAVPLAPACSPASSAPASSASSGMASPSSAQLSASPMAHAMRARQQQQQQQQQQAQQHARVRSLSLSLSPAVRCAEAPHAGMAPVDLNDVQTMADSWLRLLEQEEEELEGCERAEGSELTRGSEASGPSCIASASLGLRAASSTDSINRFMSVEGISPPGISPSGMSASGMFPSASSQSLSDLMALQRDTLSRNVSRDNLVFFSGKNTDTLSRNVSNVSLTDMVRNYSTASLEAVIEQNEALAWPHEDVAQDRPNQLGGDLDYLQGGGGEGRGYYGTNIQQHAYLQAQNSSSTGKRMQRTHSHNMLVHEAVMAVGQGMPRPASCEKLSRQCGEKEKESESNLQPEHMKLLSEQPSPNNTSDQ